jgi:predicted transcriptional regulator
VLLYSISEPGEWRAEDIAEDLPDSDPEQVRRAVEELLEQGLLHRNSTDQRLWPLRAGREAMQIDDAVGG